MLHGFERFHHYCFAREVSRITDNKPLAAIFKKRSNYIVSKTTMHVIQNSSMEGKNNIQTWTGSVCS